MIEFLDDVPILYLQTLIARRELSQDDIAIAVRYEALKNSETLNAKVY